jgi:methionine synthase I (cobalamin-dependent)
MLCPGCGRQSSLRSNRSLALEIDRLTNDEGHGQQMRDVAEKLPRADILGGCCGTDERHLGEIAGNVNNLRRAESG